MGGDCVLPRLEDALLDGGDDERPARGPEDDFSRRWVSEVFGTGFSGAGGGGGDAAREVPRGSTTLLDKGR